MIGRHRTSLTNNISKMLMESLVFLRMRYAISIWGPSLQQKHVSRLQLIQNRAVRLSYNFKKFEIIGRTYAKWLPISDLFKLSSLSAMYGQC